MRYAHRFTVAAPISEVVAFHRQARSMALITPPPIVIQMTVVPDYLRHGDEIDFTMWLGPLPVRWVARIEEVHATGFIDHQAAGPFASWSHRHEFVKLDERWTEIGDYVEAELRWRLLWTLVGLGMWISLPLLFAFRQWKTKGLLESRE